MEEGVELEEGENEEGEDEEGIYIGQNEMADDYTVDELFRMGKKNDFPRKKVIFNKKRIFYRAFLHFFSHKRGLKFILIYFPSIAIIFFYCKQSQSYVDPSFKL